MSLPIQEKKRHKKLPIKRIFVCIGVVLIGIGYVCLWIKPETIPIVAEQRAFAGMGLVMGGAAMALLTFLF